MLDGGPSPSAILTLSRSFVALVPDADFMQSVSDDRDIRPF
jgi:hypothetical protein